MRARRRSHERLLGAVPARRRLDARPSRGVAETLGRSAQPSRADWSNIGLLSQCR